MMRSRLPRKGLRMADVRRLNVEKGMYFFSPDTMKFFNSRVESELFGNKYFVTSEKFGGSREAGIPVGERMFSIRRFNPQTGDIVTEGKFQGYGTRVQAVKKAKELGGVD